MFPIFIDATTKAFCDTEAHVFFVTCFFPIVHVILVKKTQSLSREPELGIKGEPPSSLSFFKNHFIDWLL
jgi:hypothetical protein